MSLTPLALQTAFTHIHKKHVPDARQRGRMFEAAVRRLTQWWTEAFFEVEPQGSGEIQSRTFDDVAAGLLRKSTLCYDHTFSYHLDVGLKQTREVLTTKKAKLFGLASLCRNTRCFDMAHGIFLHNSSLPCVGPWEYLRGSSLACRVSHGKQASANLSPHLAPRQ